MAGEPCPACNGTRLVAPDAFGDWVPWSAYVAEIAAREAAEGWPPESSAIAAGLINPMACPLCVAPGETVVEVLGLDQVDDEQEDVEVLEPFRLGA